MEQASSQHRPSRPEGITRFARLRGAGFNSTLCDASASLNTEGRYTGPSPPMRRARPHARGESRRKQFPKHINPAIYLEDTIKPYLTL